MRTVLLLPIAALVVAAAGCGSEVREQSLPRAQRGAARAYPERDLTLVNQSPEVVVASRLELQPLRPPARLARAPRSRRLEAKPALAAVAAVAPVAAPEPVALPDGTTWTADNDRELLPGKTVTLIPASSGPSPGPVMDDFPEAPGPTMGVRGGGKCGGRGRGPGIGIATGPRPNFR